MRLRQAAGLAALALTALLATACGGSHPARSSASPGTGSVQQLDAYAACMRDHAVLNFYFTNSRPSGTSPALSVMGHYVTGVNPQTTQFAACMRSHGYPDYPDPVIQNGGVEEKPLPSSIDTSSARFLAAEKICNTS